MLDTVIQSDRIYVDDRLIKGYIGIKDEKIVYLDRENPGAASNDGDAAHFLVLPGLVDSHVHLREPGNAHRETFRTGTLAAANGGVTTIVEHPLASPPPYNLEILFNRFKAAEGEIAVDMAFMGAAGEHNLTDIAAFAKSGYIVGFKTFLHEAPAGREIEFNGLTMCNDGVVYAGIQELAKAGILWTLHAENNDMIQYNIKKFIAANDLTPINHAKSRPAITETETVAKILLLTEETDLPVLFCHISNPAAAELIKRAKQRGRRVYMETCPHYLCFTEELLNRYGSYAKCNPPLRTEEERQAMWNYVADGTVDVIGSDHAPYSVEEKEKGNIFSACAGFPAIEFRFPLMFTKVKEGRLPLSRFVELLCKNPAKLFKLYPQKGSLSIGADADVIIVDPEKTYKIAIDTLQTKSRQSAVLFDNVEVTGEIVATLVRGHFVKKNGKVLTDAERPGKILKPLL